MRYLKRIWRGLNFGDTIALVGVVPMRLQHALQHRTASDFRRECWLARRVIADKKRTFPNRRRTCLYGSYGVKRNVRRLVSALNLTFSLC